MSFAPRGLILCRKPATSKSQLARTPDDGAQRRRPSLRSGQGFTSAVGLHGARPDAPAPAARSGATLRRAGPGLTSAVGLHGAPSGRAGAGGAQRRHPPPGRPRPHIGGRPPRCPVRTRRRRRRAATPPSAGPVPASHRRPASTVPRPDAPAPAARSGATLRRAGQGFTSAVGLHGALPDAPAPAARSGVTFRRDRSRPHIGGRFPRCPIRTPPASEACNAASPSPGGSRWRGLAKGHPLDTILRVSKIHNSRNSDRNASETRIF